MLRAQLENINYFLTLVDLLSKPWQLLLKNIFLSPIIVMISRFQIYLEKHATKNEEWQNRSCKSCKYRVNIAFSHWKGASHVRFDWILWLPARTIGFILTHTSYIHIIPVSHKNHSLGYILHFLKKTLNKKLLYYYGKNNFSIPYLNRSYIVMYLLFN